MHNDAGLVVTIAMGLVLAAIFGFLASRIRLPPLVGYLFAGIMVGPFTPGIVADPVLASQLAEVGVILLMFGVGLHFSIDDLIAVRHVAVPGAVLQIILATAIGSAIAVSWGWSFGGGLIFGLSLSVASTVVLLRALDEQNAVRGAEGRIAVGWLIIEDLAMVLALVLIPALAEVSNGLVPGHLTEAQADPGLWLTLLGTCFKVAAFVAVMMLVGPYVLPPALRQVARAGSRELFTLTVLALALGIALAATEVFGVSFALGAFCAGVVLAKSEYSQRAATESLPLQDAFAVLFFVSVGMLFDPSILIRQPLAVLVTLFVIVIGKTLIAFSIVMLLGYPARTALIVSASLAQIGEFSFILANLGLSLSLMPSEGRDLILAGAILSIMFNPALFASVQPLSDWIAARSKLQPDTNRRPIKLAALVARLKLRQQEAEAHGPRRTALSEDIIGNFPIFRSCSPKARTELVSLFTSRIAHPGDRIIRRGEPSEELLFISSGSVEVVLPEGNVILGSGDFFGEMGVLKGARRSADVTAVDFTELLTLSRRDFLQFIEKHPELREAIWAIADDRMETNRKTTEVHKTTPAQTSV